MLLNTLSKAISRQLPRNLPAFLSRAHLTGAKNFSILRQTRFPTPIMLRKYFSTTGATEGVPFTPKPIPAEFSENFFTEDQENTIDRLVKPGKQKVVGYWLLLTASAVFVMIVLGGYTRVSKSGLSMVKWRPINYQLPST
jgi:hypothetical protein